MKKFNNAFLDAGYFAYRIIEPIVDPLKLIQSIPSYSRYVYELFRYTRINGAERQHLLDAYPKVYERTSDHDFGYGIHYFYQDVWAFKKIYQSRAKHHYDVGSNISICSLLTAFTKVTYIDIRPLNAKLNNLDSQKGDILALPYKTNSLRSLSCLHVAEHIGLGRYDDQLDPEGTKKACRELARVLAIGGNLYFSLPTGKPRLCFNAHRVHAPKQILEYFKDLELLEFSGIDDEGNFQENIRPNVLEKSDYACGLFLFRKS